MKPTKKVLMGSTVLAVTLGMGSIVAFAGTNSTTQHVGGPGGFGGPGGMLTTAAKALNLSTSTLQTDLKSGKTLAQVASAQGVSTATLISDLEAAQQSQMATQVSNFVNGTHPKQGGPGVGGMRGPGGFGGPGGMLTTAAKELNVSASTLQSDLKSGKTLAQIASAQGVSTATLISDLEAAQQSNLSSLVSSGKITSTQEQQMLSRMATQVSNFVNGTQPKQGVPGVGGMRGPGGPGGMLTTAAKALNVSTSTLQSDLKSGKTLAQIASAQGVSTATLISDLEAARQSRMDTQVSNFVNGTLPHWGGHVGNQSLSNGSGNSNTVQ
ncbi:hypothetical protein D2Q93_15255 [Alicyclobacillaceae bacterium I2511]|nr:hypothetical protein D2Q93_15255 [Alicyclobacillaceae bacterium I2511]